MLTKTEGMQVYTSPVPAYLLSALPLHLPSIHIPHLWAHKLLSLCHFSVKDRRKCMEFKFMLYDSYETEVQAAAVTSENMGFCWLSGCFSPQFVYMKTSF